MDVLAAFERWLSSRHAEPEPLRRAKVVVMGSIVAAIATAGLAFGRFILTPDSSVPLILSLAVVGFAAAGGVGSLGAKLGGWLLPLAGLAAVSAMAYAEGGLLSESMFWLPFVPFVAVLTVGARGAIGCGGLALAVVIVFFVDEPAAKSTPAATILHAMGLAGAVMFATGLGWVYERSRAAAQRAIEEGRVAAETANVAKSAFLASMSHELRTPLTAVIGFSGQLLKNADKWEADRRRMMLERIACNGRHLLEVINDVLDLSKIEAGQLDVVREEADVAQIAREALELVGDPKAGVTLGTRHLDERAPITCDPHRLKQVIVNLVANAVKFTPAPGRVQVVLVRDGDGEPIRLDVRDSGIGIPESSLSAVFEPFRQVDEGHAREYEGTGLGLPISARLCDAMGFELTAVSQVEVGSVFSIAFQSEAPPAALAFEGGADPS